MRALLKQYPHASGLIQQLSFRTLHDPDVATDEFLAITDLYQKFAAENPDQVLSVPPLFISLADAYVRHNVRLDQVPKMIDKGLTQFERGRKYQLDRSLLPKAPPGREMDHSAITYSRAHQVMADYYLAIRDYEKARVATGQMAADVEKFKPQPYEYHHGEYLKRMAKLDEAQGRKSEALERYREVFGRYDPKVLAESKDPYVTAARRLYVEQGNDESKFIEWMKEAAKPLPERPPTAFTKAVPAFSLKDINGRTWTNADLQGKATLVNIWATWCGPCRFEHPDVQKLHEKLKDRKDLQVLTVSIDDNPTLIAPYMKEKNYTFPVLASREFADGLFGSFMVPQNWIINPEGKRSEDMARAGAEWVSTIVTELEKALGKMKQ